MEVLKKILLKRKFLHKNKFLIKIFRKANSGNKFSLKMEIKKKIIKIYVSSGIFLRNMLSITFV